MEQVMQKALQLGEISISNDAPMVLVGGLNVLESESLALETAEAFKTCCEKLNIPYIFKASFDKANRSSIDSYRGPGLEKGLKILEAVKQQIDVPLLTDADIIQLPAFLSRQTDLVVAMAQTRAFINIKKAQFLAPAEMQHIIKKFLDAGNEKLMLCERGSSFGYNNLVVDMLGFPILKSFSYPVLFDVTHALQMPGARTNSADGRRKDVTALAKSGIAQGIAGLFLEAHPDPDKALCDGPCALPLNKLEVFLQQIKDLDDLIKSQQAIDTA